MSQSSKPIPLAIPNDLLDQIDQMATATNISKQELMRLCIRIGLSDMGAINQDIAAAVRDAVMDKGAAFRQWATSIKPMAPSTVRSGAKAAMQELVTGDVALLAETPANYKARRKA